MGELSGQMRLQVAERPAPGPGCIGHRVPGAISSRARCLYPQHPGKSDCWQSSTAARRRSRHSCKDPGSHVPLGGAARLVSQRSMESVPYPVHHRPGPEGQALLPPVEGRQHVRGGVRKRELQVHPSVTDAREEP
ncbi:hypothetical protein NDU88_009459 [Pleurodeles waltl]|uniref:Uncharacterized protein n=1 Tax=Pleurodeles waltl TaxID=8319 RepID=A0AAV7P112_PLEWA|nr:hypothetical protein NDU88_009459 [Pleurodeles waltl]